jgi:MarR family 2-MHQ and catechol resistance regulon transcriptional repressor
MQNTSGVHIWLVMMKAARAIADCTAQSRGGSELGDSDFRVLEVLLHKGAMPVNAIGPKVFLTPGSISVAVERLHEKGLVSRVDSDCDRRVRVVDLTPEGRKLIKRVFSAHANQMEELVSVLTDTERLQLLGSLKKLGKHAAASSLVSIKASAKNSAGPV